MKLKTGAAIILALTTLPAAAQEDTDPTPPMPAFDLVELRTEQNDYAATQSPDRITRVATKNQRGTSIGFPRPDVVRLCGDQDGCSVRIGMHNWDDTGRVASRDFLFFYNPRSHVWRASRAVTGAAGPESDMAGTDSNNNGEHVGYAWGCYLTDAEYVDGAHTDGVLGFGVLSWTNWNADCWITLID